MTGIAMSPLPLIGHRHLDDILAYRGGVPISAGQFLADVAWLAGRLPPGRHVLNVCSDRYRFTVAFAACVVSGRVSLLPSTHTPETVRQMQGIAPDVFCVTDHDGGAMDLPTFRYPAGAGEAGVPIAVPQVDAGQIVAQVFTSGSTGLPVPHPKRWGTMVRSVLAEAARLGVGPCHAVLGTVPAQHMYGLESTVLMPLQSGAALHAGHPFYPADICATLAELPRPRLLVTTPFHLRAMLADPALLPEVDLLLSATAPLSQNLAEEAESRFAAPLFEIYGCTEAGQIASRRTRSGPGWDTLQGLCLRRAGESVLVEGDFIDTPTALGDVIELTGGESVSTTFLLHGRQADLVNIAGKRTSLAYLNYHLNAIPGVEDGVFILPGEETAGAVTRLSALVVAPGLTPAGLMHALRERIDPIFLPRPLHFVAALPRNATGKLPGRAVQDLLASLQGSRHD